MSGEMTKISQMPVVLIPVHFDRSNIERTTSFQRSVVIRPFITQDFMTGIPAIPGKDISLEVGLFISFIILVTRKNNINVHHKRLSNDFIDFR